MSDQIKINVEINGQPSSLADVSLETLIVLRDRAVLAVKRVKHGDYGISKTSPRLFIKTKYGVSGYSARGDLMVDDINAYYRRDEYTILGNIFKDMEKANDDS